MNSVGLTFGVYPLGVAGTPVGLAVGPKDDFEKIILAIKELKGDANKFLSRTYAVYMGPESEDRVLAAIDRYYHAGLLGDLTIGCLQDPELALDYWLNFVRKVIQQYGSYLDSIQITNEPNLTFMDGSKPYVLQALVQGVLTAKDEILKNNLQTSIGFGSVPEGQKTIPQFWNKLIAVGGDELINSVDYIGHNFYVDVFEDPLDLKDVSVSVENILRNFRETLTRNDIPSSMPIRITENGWPTGKNPFIQVDRTYDQQVNVIQSVVRTIHSLREELGITHYEFFGLRDADSSKDDLFHQFGLMRDDYTPKPAYFTYKNLIKEFSN